MATFRAMVGDHVIAESDATITVEGFRYFPQESVKPDVLHRTRMKSVCFWKGVASYYSATIDGATRRNAAWTYLHPSPLARRIKGHVAFWPGDVAVVQG